MRMRKVQLTVSKFSLIVGDTMSIQLVDTVGNKLISPRGYLFDETITVSSDIVEIELLENDHIHGISNYKLMLPSGLNFNFKVPVSDTTVPHELTSLLSIGCVYGVIDIDGGRLDDRFVEKLDLFFSGENPHFSDAQKDVVRLYTYYADSVHGGTSTIDVMRMMDEYHATLKGE